MVLEGFVDRCNSYEIVGWTYDDSHNDGVVSIDIVISGHSFKNIPAKDFREDLRKAGKGNGKHGFLFRIPKKLKSGTPKKVEIYFSQTKKHLVGSPTTIFHRENDFLDKINKCLVVEQWNIENITFFNDHMEITGWALAPDSKTKVVSFRVNGNSFDDVDYPINREDVARLLWYRKDANRSGFICRKKIDECNLSKNDFLQFDYIYPKKPKITPIQNTWFYKHSEETMPIPPFKNIRRVARREINTPRFLMVGFTNFMKLQFILEKKIGRSINDFNRLLDWGCGCGRLTRYLSQIKGPKIFGADVDKENISWCTRNITNVQFSTISIYPPMPFASNYFDLIIGISIFTHLNKEFQFRWLEEINRIATSNAVILMTTHGKTSLFRSGTTTELFNKFVEKGFVVAGKNDQIADIVIKDDYYVNSFHSEEYISKEWAKYFKIIEILPGFIGHQDLIMMEKLSS